MEAHSFPLPSERPDLWPWALRLVPPAHLAPGECDLDQTRPEAYTLAGHRLNSLSDQPRFSAIDLQDLHGQANVWATAYAEEFWDGYGMAGASVMCSGWELDYPRIVSILAQYGLAFECWRADQVRRVCAAGADAQALRVHLNTDTLAQCVTDTAVQQVCWIVPAVFSSRTAVLARESGSGAVCVDLRSHPAEQWRSAVSAYIREGLMLEGICVGFSVEPGAAGPAVEEVAFALEILHDFAGRRLIVELDYPADALALQPSAVIQARALADSVRQCCGDNAAVPAVDVLPQPALVAHSVCDVDTGAGMLRPGGDVTPELLVGVEPSGVSVLLAEE